MAEGIVTPIPLTDTGHYFTIAEFRAFDSAASDFTDAQIDESRRWAEQRFEHAAGCAWVERTGVAKLVGDGGAFITLWHRDIRTIMSVTVNGVALTADELASLVVHPHGLVKRYAGWTRDTLIVATYTYGLVDAEDFEVAKVAVMMLTGHRLLPSNLRQNVTSESTDSGFYRVAHATPGGKTGLLEVDAVAADHGHAGGNVG